MARNAPSIMLDQFGPETGPIAKALGAAFAGRALLLLDARRDMPITVRRILTAVLWEVPLICAFAMIGWHLAPLLGLDHENGRVVVTTLLANLGARGLDRLVARFLPAAGEKK